MKESFLTNFDNSDMNCSFLTTAQCSTGIVADVEETTELKPREEEMVIPSSSELSDDLIGGDIDREDTREEDDTQITSELLVDSSPCFESVSLHFFDFLNFRR